MCLTELPCLKSFALFSWGTLFHLTLANKSGIIIIGNIKTIPTGFFKLMEGDKVLAEETKFPIYAAVHNSQVSGGEGNREGKIELCAASNLVPTTVGVPEEDLWSSEDGYSVVGKCLPLANTARSELDNDNVGYDLPLDHRQTLEEDSKPPCMKPMSNAISRSRPLQQTRQSKIFSNSCFSSGSCKMFVGLLVIVTVFFAGLVAVISVEVSSLRNEVEIGAAVRLKETSTWDYFQRKSLGDLQTIKSILNQDLIQDYFEELVNVYRDLASMVNQTLELVKKNHIAHSCDDLFRLIPSSSSGEYWIRNPNGTEVKVYCHMNLTCGGRSGGWMRVDHITAGQTANSSSCPACESENGYIDVPNTTLSINSLVYSRLCILANGCSPDEHIRVSIKNSTSSILDFAPCHSGLFPENNSTFQTIQPCGSKFCPLPSGNNSTVATSCCKSSSVPQPLLAELGRAADDDIQILIQQNENDDGGASRAFFDQLDIFIQ